ncbi:MAG: hypothetical protein DRQ01_00665 [Ignavibacteriae bacterium]|nr:MAG: hypothetical protein DRQ01_00665 [Ignavibacteriota bacterium]
MIKIPLAILSVSILLINSNPVSYIPKLTETEPIKIEINPLVKYDFRNLRDTLYTMEDNIIEVNLSTQHVKLISRDGSIKEFPVSSGTKRIEKGMDTREGLFVLHWKSKKLHSEQFDSTLMLNWMGFNGGIGFHALLGTRYYKYLGKRNVSHGCVRMNREDAKEMYGIVEKGTPVLVHSGNNAITIDFGKEGTVYKYYDYKTLHKLISARFEVIYNGNYFVSAQPKLLIDKENVSHSGLPIGDSEKLPSKQFIKPAYLYVDHNTNDVEKLEYISEGKNRKYLTLNSFLDSQ